MAAKRLVEARGYFELSTLDVAVICAALLTFERVHGKDGPSEGVAHLDRLSHRFRASLRDMNRIEKDEGARYGL